ncbi:MAG: respiratory nitrate reductase subunit gamma [Thermoleophilaceae bacterium]|nr:respiratory nitrate reductase subunit gamma [Thermoleophilaceae bacterium]
MNDKADVLVWGAIPYVVIAIFVLGHLWRYRTSQYTWTTRSTQLLERKMLRWGILLFHFGMLAVLGGHIGGILVPKEATEAVGVTEDMYHSVAVLMGSISGIAMTAGLLILAVRRTTNERVRATTIRRDYLTVGVLLLVVITGMINTFGVQLLGTAHDYRETVSPWFRSILMLQPDPSLMTQAPWSFRLHAASAMLLFAIWPFTRLVHAWSIPLAFVTRPPIIFRRRDSVAR